HGRDPAAPGVTVDRDGNLRALAGPEGGDDLGRDLDPGGIAGRFDRGRESHVCSPFSVAQRVSCPVKEVRVAARYLSAGRPVFSPSGRLRVPRPAGSRSRTAPTSGGPRRAGWWQQSAGPDSAGAWDPYRDHPAVPMAGPQIPAEQAS